MPNLVDYQTVLSTLTASGLVCNYHNSGSFGLTAVDSQTVGWLTEADPTIRPEMLQRSRIIGSGGLIGNLQRMWLSHLSTTLWIMPASHWAFELTYGNAAWLPQRLKSIGIDPDILRDRNDGSAIAFAPQESDAMGTLVNDLLTCSTGSDFTAAWPGHAAVAMLHHHQQIWWRTTDVALATNLRAIE